MRGNHAPYVPDKYEGMRLRKVVVEGLTAEDVNSTDFFKIVLPCEAIYIINPQDGEERCVSLLLLFPVHLTFSQ